MSNYSQWATAALQFPNMASVVIDTTGISNYADIVRVYVATTTDPKYYDQLFYSERHRTSNEHYTGIPEDALLEAPTLPEEWEHLRAVLTVREVAKLLRCSTSEVRRRSLQGALPCVCLPLSVARHLNRFYRFRRADIEHMREARRG